MGVKSGKTHWGCSPVADSFSLDGWVSEPLGPRVLHLLTLPLYLLPCVQRVVSNGRKRWKVAFVRKVLRKVLCLRCILGLSGGSWMW